MNKLDISKEWLINLHDIEYISSINTNVNVEIYKAYWRKYQVVCVKKVKVTEVNVCLLEREIDILSKCVHPKVCQYLGTGLDEESAYMLFEYMENGNLQDYVVNNVLDVSEKQSIMKSILIGMNYLTSRTPQKILHRDFKPSNILIGKHKEVKICDFGVSKELFNEDVNDHTIHKKNYNLMVLHSPEESDISHTGVGTLRWSAPELITSNTIYDERCDIYSFGLIAYFILTDGVIPYYNEYQCNLAQIAYAKAENIRPFLNHPKVQEFESMLEMITKCTEKDAALRPRNANLILDTYFKE